MNKSALLYAYSSHPQPPKSRLKLGQEIDRASFDECGTA